MVYYSAQIMNNSILKIIWFFYKPYKLQILILLALSLVVGSLEAANVAIIYPLLSTAFETGFPEGNIILSLLSRMSRLLPIEDQFIAYCVLFLIFALVAFGIRLFSISFRVRFSARLVQNNQNEIFQKFIRADYQYFIDHRQGELIYNVSSAPQRLSTLIAAVTGLVSQAILSISIILLLFSLSWQGTTGVLLIGVGYYFFTRYLGRRVSYASGMGEMEAIRESNVILNEAISGIKQVKVFATGNDWITKFRNILKERWYHSIRRNIWQQIPGRVLMLLTYLFIGIIVMVIKIMSPDSFIEMLPMFGTFAVAAFRLFPIMSALGGLVMQIMAALPNCETVYSIRTDRITYIEDGEEELDSFRSEIKFENVTFTYRGRLKILEDISTVFEKGKTTAIVGRSGAGKTTILNLILRLFEPDRGTIRIDGRDIKEYRLPSWLNKIGFVSQDTYIFNDTVRNNITFRVDNYSDAEITRVAQYADAHNFISELPEAYDTLVGDKGVKLSTGQGQRIAVARAMLKAPEILIFDEATNALDNISEVSVQKAIDQISKDHTVIVVAHRLSTIVNADKIIVLGDGHILEEGTHQELMAMGGAYWELYRSQPVL